MPATPARIAFITRPYRTALALDEDVASLYGDMARETNRDDPIETFFDSVDDAQAIADERLELLSPERRRWQVVLGDAIPLLAALSIDQTSPTVTVIDRDRATTRPAIITEMKLNFRDGSASISLWG